MIPMKKILCLTALASALAACQGGGRQDGEAQAADVARQFAEAYVQLDLHRASSLCTPESRWWMSFLASNLTQADLDVYNAQPQAATAQAEGLTMLSDTTARASLSVSGCLLLDSLGHSARVAEEARLTLTLVRRDARWLVSLQGLPRPQ